MYTPDEIAEHQFLISLRGYDREEVTGFLDEVADQVRHLRQRVEELESQAARAVEQPAEDAAPTPSFRHIGEETTRILEAAERAAEEMRSRAEQEARELLEGSRREAAEEREAAQREAAEERETAQREAAEEREAAQREASELLEEARRRAQGEQDRANSTATEVLEEARRSAREALDTAETQQREISEQVDQLRDVRSRLVEDLRAVARTVDGALDRLGGEASAVGAASEAAPLEAPGEEPAPPEPGEPETVVAVTDADVEAPGPGPEADVEVPGPGPAVDAEAGEDVAASPPTDEPPVPQDRAPADATAGEDPAPAVADVASRELRDQALLAIRPGMLRRLKRTLQDVQNGVLDGIRRAGPDASPSQLLPGDDDLAPLLSVGEAFLGEAYRAGLGDGATLAAVPPHEDAADPERVAAASAEFRATVGREIVAALEPSLAAGVEAGEDEAGLADRVSEVFRDLKGPVAERATEASLLRTYELGTHDVWLHAGVGARVWVLGEETRCPENRCRANVEEGPVPLDRPFASGDTVPPAHGGCTCTLAPS